MQVTTKKKIKPRRTPSHRENPKERTVAAKMHKRRKNSRSCRRRREESPFCPSYNFRVVRVFRGHTISWPSPGKFESRHLDFYNRDELTRLSCPVSYTHLTLPTKRIV